MVICGDIFRGGGGGGRTLLLEHTRLRSRCDESFDMGSGWIGKRRRFAVYEVRLGKSSPIY